MTPGDVAHASDPAVRFAKPGRVKKTRPGFCMNCNCCRQQRSSYRRTSNVSVGINSVSGWGGGSMPSSMEPVLAHAAAMNAIERTADDTASLNLGLVVRSVDISFSP